MREVVFKAKNAEKWQKYELLIAQKQGNDPDMLADLYIQLTDDLSYAKTFYPQSRLTGYLNSLALKIHRSIYRRKLEKSSSILKFWTEELPLLFYIHRRLLLISLIIFCAAVFIGALSAANDARFVRMILGDSYVNMTEANIRQGDPMAVYKKMNGLDMFLGITLNNIKVSFLAFVYGVFFGVGSALIMLYNGVMLGAFESFFFTHGLLGKSLLSVSIHGIIEISSIIIAGAAGLLIGKGILLPGTWSRRISFIKAASDGVRIIIGLIPLFIIAGFFESFITRYTNMPVYVNILIIFTAAFFMIWYVFILPKKIYLRGKNGPK